MASPIKSHLPLISTRIEFKYDELPVPPHITARRDFTTSLRKHFRQMSAPYNQMRDREPVPMRSVRFRDRSNSPTSISLVNGHYENASTVQGARDALTIPPKSAKPQVRLDSPLTDISDDASETGDSNNMRPPITKPIGEVGRTNSGGYNLQTALGWDEKRFKAFNKLVDDKIEAKLDPNLCFSKQNPAILEEVMRSTTKDFKINGQYVKDWPVRDAFKSHLKYSSEYAKKKTERRVTTGIKKAASVLDTRKSASVA